MGEVTPLHKGEQVKPDEKITLPVPLDPTHIVEGFDCGKPPLNEWLRYHARKSEGRGARTFVVCVERRIVGFYAMCAGAVEHDGAPKNIARNMPDPIPVFVLGRLAVDQAYQHSRGFGPGLLKDALKRAVYASKEIGSRAVIVHAIDNEARGFYLHYKFKPFPTDERTLYMPVSHIIAAL